MRVVVMADTFAKYLDWCALHRVHPSAARYTREHPSLRPGDVLVDLDIAATAPSFESLAAPNEAA